MKKWSDRELNAVEWAIRYISAGSVEAEYREDILKIKERPVAQHVFYSSSEKRAIAAAISYFENFYSYSVKGLPKGNKTVASALVRLSYLESAREKLFSASVTESSVKEYTKKRLCYRKNDKID